MAGKFYDGVGHRAGILGTPDANGASYQADVDASNRLQVAVATSPGGVLNGTGQVSLGTSATLIIAAGTRQGVVITNPSSTVTIYVGGSGVTTSNGQIVPPLQSVTLPVVSAVYGVVVSSTQTVSYAEVV
jgi:hypothetical protein